MPCALTVLALVLPAFAGAGPGAQPPQRPAAEGIFGQDDRRPISSRGYPWAAIGRVNSTLGPFCTGTLIGPRVVLTAAHCLWNNRTNDWIPPCALHFLAGYERGNYAAHSLVTLYRVEGRPGELPAAFAENIPSRDWALLYLAEDLGDTIQPVAVASRPGQRLQDALEGKQGLLQAGYNRDYAHILTTNQPCEVTELFAAGRLLRHRCDATFGSSGSPLMLGGGEEASIVAMLVGVDKNGKAGIAVTGEVFAGPQMLSDEDVPAIRAEAC